MPKIVQQRRLVAARDPTDGIVHGVPLLSLVRQPMNQQRHRSSISPYDSRLFCHSAHRPGPSTISPNIFSPLSGLSLLRNVAHEPVKNALRGPVIFPYRSLVVLAGWGWDETNSKETPA